MIAWGVKENLGMPVAKVANPEGTTVLEMAKATGVCNELPGEFALISKRTKPPVVVAWGVEEDLGTTIGVTEVANPEGTAILEMAKTGGVCDIAPREFPVPGKGTEPPVPLVRLIVKHLGILVCAESANFRQFLIRCSGRRSLIRCSGHLFSNFLGFRAESDPQPDGSYNEEEYQHPYRANDSVYENGDQRTACIFCCKKCWVLRQIVNGDCGIDRLV